MTDPTSLREVIARWRQEQERFAQLGLMANAAALTGVILDDIEAAEDGLADELLDLSAAATESGYSKSHISRLIRDGFLSNAGKPHAPLVRRADLPRKPRSLRCPRPRVQLLNVRPGQVARAIVDAQKGAPR